MYNHSHVTNQAMFSNLNKRRPKNILEKQALDRLITCKDQVLIMINKPAITENNSQNKMSTESGGKAAPESELPHLAAATLAQGWMGKIKGRKGERCVSANELTSLSALIVYVAHKTGTNEFRIERDLADRFNVANAKYLPASRYDEAVQYLVDLVPVTPAV
jgi:hypothetical protein